MCRARRMRDGRLHIAQIARNRHDLNRVNHPPRFGLAALDGKASVDYWISSRISKKR